MDLNKEIKLSDLFKRGEKEAVKPDRAEASAPSEKRDRKGAPPAPQLPLMRAFDLMPRDEAREGKGRRGAPAQIALAVVAVLAFGALGSVYLVSSAGVAEKEAKRDELRTKLAALNVPAKAPTDPQAPALATERQTRTAELATALQRRVAWDRVLRDFALVLPEDVWLTSFVAQGAPEDGVAAPAEGGTPSGGSQGPSFTINGYTHDQESVARLLARLSVLPELAHVALLSSARVEVNKRKVVQFSVTATVKPAGGGTA